MTDTSEVVGPVFFMAPELEGGTNLQVEPAADIYSLGKVLYYMFSGGVTLPRERLDEESYNNIFDGSEQHLLFQSLLRRMVCPLAQRIRSVVDVLSSLERIEKWESTAQTLALTPNALANLRTLQQKAQSHIDVAKRNRSIQEFEETQLKNTSASVGEWLSSELLKVRTHLISLGPFDSRVDSLSESSRVGPLRASETTAYVLDRGVSLSFARKQASSASAYTFSVALCTEGNLDGMFSEEEGEKDALGILIAKDQQLCLIPMFHKGLFHNSLQKPFRYPTLSIDGLSDNEVHSEAKNPPWENTFDTDFSEKFSFKISDWPEIRPAANTALASWLEVFLHFAKTE